MAGHLGGRPSVISRPGGDPAAGVRSLASSFSRSDTSTARFLKAVNRIPFKFNVTITGPFRALIATAKSYRDPRSVVNEALPVPLDAIPGITTEVRRREEDKAQTQTPIDQKIEVTPTPPAEGEQR